MKRKSGLTSTLIAKGLLVDADSNLRYNTHMFNRKASMFSNVKLSEVREGSVVIVRGNFGNGPEERVVVENVERDIKNGQPGIDYDGHWAYLSQVQRVVKY
jgi:hypothetical protein